jgi:hypothetical protein
VLLVVAVVALVTPRVRADVAGWGSFSVGSSSVPASPDVPLEGEIVFDSHPVTPLGTPVDLGVSVGLMRLTGSAVVGDAPPGATFLLSADDPDSTFAFDASGGGACDQPGCVGGIATFAGRIGSVVPGFLPDGVFTFDGTASLALPSGPAGAVALNAFPSILTAEGVMVTVASGPSSYWDSRTRTVRTFAAQATFEAVPAAGTTSFAGLSSVAGAPPAGIGLSVPLSVFVDVETTAAVSGAVRVCVAYDDAEEDGVDDRSGISVDRLRLLRAVSPTFADITTTVGEGLVCGTTPGPSAFVIGAADASSTSTTIAGGGVTTTTLPLGGCTEPVSCLETALGQPLCGGEQLNPKLRAVVAARLGKARSLLQRAATVPAAKVAKLVGRARRQLDRVGARADAFVARRKRPITAGCRDAIRAALDRIEALIVATDAPFACPS